jgi:hypothetical protein
MKARSQARDNKTKFSQPALQYLKENIFKNCRKLLDLGTNHGKICRRRQPQERNSIQHSIKVNNCIARFASGKWCIAKSQTPQEEEDK